MPSVWAVFYCFFIYIYYYCALQKGCDKMKYVVEYMKNLVPVFVRSGDIQISENDVEFLADIANDMDYLIAKNGIMYWYYFIDEASVSVARDRFRKNGINPKFHYSRYYMGGVPVLRIRKAKLDKNKAARNFVNLLMKAKRQR